MSVLRSVRSSSRLRAAGKRPNYLMLSLLFLFGAIVVLAIAYGVGSTKFALFLVSFSLIALVAFLAYYPKEHLVDVFDPFYIIIVLYGLYAGGAASFVVAYGVNWESEPVSSTALDIYYVSVLVGLIALVLGFLFVQSATTKTGIISRLTSVRLRLDERRFENGLILMTILILLITLPTVLASLDPRNVPSYSQIALPWRVESRENLAGGVNRYFGRELPLLLLVCTALLVGRRNQRVRVLMMVVLGLYVLVGTLSGSRGVFISVLLLLLLFRHYRVKRLTIPQVLLPVIVLYVFANTLPYVRTTSDLGEMITEAVRGLTTDASFLSPAHSGEFAGPPMNLMTLIDGIEGGRTGFTYGLSYLSELLIIIPRPLFPNRPLPLSELFMVTFYPQVYALGGGFGFFMPMEGYWAFGIPGVFLTMFAYGTFVAIVYRFLITNRDSNALVLIYGAAFYFLVIASIRTGMIGSIKGTLLIALPFVLLVLVSRKTGAGEAQC